MQIYIILWRHASFHCASAVHFSATLVPSWVTREDMLAARGGGLCGRGGLAGPHSVSGTRGGHLKRLLGNAASQRHFCGPSFYFCWEEDEEGLEGWRKGIEQREAACGCNRRSRRGMILIHVFHFQPLSILWYLFPSCHFSWFQPPAPARLWTLSPPSIHPLYPFTCRLLFCSFLSLHLSYIPMVHLGCGCQPQTHRYYYPGGSFRLQFSMIKIRATR